jgi:hypothetical protein
LCRHFSHLSTLPLSLLSSLAVLASLRLPLPSLAVLASIATALSLFNSFYFDDFLMYVPHALCPSPLACVSCLLPLASCPLSLAPRTPYLSSLASCILILFFLKKKTYSTQSARHVRL